MRALFLPEFKFLLLRTGESRVRILLSANSLILKTEWQKAQACWCGYLTLLHGEDAVTGTYRKRLFLHW